jgi:hypothetical protein
MIMALTFTLYPVVISITDELSIENSNFAIFYDSIDFVFLTHYYFFRGSIAWRSNKQSTFFLYLSSSFYEEETLKFCLWRVLLCVDIFCIMTCLNISIFSFGNVFIYLAMKWKEKTSETGELFRVTRNNKKKTMSGEWNESEKLLKITTRFFIFIFLCDEVIFLSIHTK